jgi:hypothetical protein
MLAIVAPARLCRHVVVPATSLIFCIFVKDDDVPLFWGRAQARKNLSMGINSFM